MPMQGIVRRSQLAKAAAVAALTLAGAASAAEWTNWRGPYQNGVSPETRRG